MSVSEKFLEVPGCWNLHLLPFKQCHHFCFWALGLFHTAVLALLPVEPQQMGKGSGWGMEDDGSGSDSALECSLVTGLPGVLCQCRILQLRWERVLQPDHRHVPWLPQVRAGWRTLHGNFSFFCCWGAQIEHQMQKTNALLHGSSVWVGKEMGKGMDA